MGIEQSPVESGLHTVVLREGESGKESSREASTGSHFPVTVSEPQFTVSPCGFSRKLPLGLKIPSPLLSRQFCGLSHHCLDPEGCGPDALLEVLGCAPLEALLLAPTLPHLPVHMDTYPTLPTSWPHPIHTSIYLAVPTHLSFVLHFLHLPPPLFCLFPSPTPDLQPWTLLSQPSRKPPRWVCLCKCCWIWILLPALG